MVRFAWSGLFAIYLMLVACVAVAQGYRVQPGDVLVIEVAEDPSLNRTTTILPDGTFNFPFAGTQRASGRTVPQIERRLSNAIASNFATTPTVFISVQPLEREPEEPEMINIYVLGEVTTPGLVELEPRSTILQAIAVAGGPSRFAATKRLQLRRTDPLTRRQSVTIINYKALSEGAVLNNDLELKNGDVILFPERRLFE